ncbi:hypothetical protein [Halobacillus massiliensis]|uniref:hypothetical protein n=1 Tax=Halobacillus massiliensis TaxID=1926286 RepID=UPI0015C47C3D|nr:hypothetical protein [Halobacillus massiliensis]
MSSQSERKQKWKERRKETLRFFWELFWWVPEIIVFPIRLLLLFGKGIVRVIRILIEAL